MWNAIPPLGTPRPIGRIFLYKRIIRYKFYTNIPSERIFVLLFNCVISRFIIFHLNMKVIFTVIGIRLKAIIDRMSIITYITISKCL